MSKKQQIEDALDAGKEYDEIEQETGATRGYIRSIASKHSKGATEEDMGEETPESKPEDQKTSENDALNLIDDVKKPEASKGRYQEFGAWLKERKYECNCGCVVGRKTKYCPHCGVELDWTGVD